MTIYAVQVYDRSSAGAAYSTPATLYVTADETAGAIGAAKIVYPTNARYKATAIRYITITTGGRTFLLPFVDGWDPPCP